MPATLPLIGEARKANGSASAFPPAPHVESVGKTDAVRFLTAAIEGYLARTQTTRAALAAQCRMSEGYFSKRASGQQGDLIEFVCALPAEIRAEFFSALAEAERVDPFLVAAEQMVTVAVRVIRLAAAMGVRPKRMARVELER